MWFSEVEEVRSGGKGRQSSMGKTETLSEPGLPWDEGVGVHCTMQQTVGQKLFLGEGKGSKLLMLGCLIAGVCGCFRSSDMGLHLAWV